MKTELLSPGQNSAGLAEGGVPQLRATHAENAGLPYLGRGSAAGAAPPERFWAAGGVRG